MNPKDINDQPTGRLIITGYYGPANKILDVESIDLTAKEASQLSHAICSMVIGMAELRRGSKYVEKKGTNENPSSN